MAHPSGYTVGYDFSDFQALNPAKPMPGLSLDNELENVSTAVNSLRSAVLDVRREDGALKNGIVTLDALTPTLQAAIGGDVLTYIERAEDAAADAEVAAGAAELARDAAQSAQSGAVAAQALAEAARDTAQALAGANATEIVFTPAGGIAATDVAAALAELDTEKAAASHGHAATAITTTVSGMTGATVQAILDLLGVARLRTGDYVLSIDDDARSGWVLCDDGTIGPASSGATTRANADCEALYLLMWAKISNTHAPVTGGRGVSAAADWAAGKTMALTKMLGRALIVAGAGSGLTSRAVGQTLGAETHQLTTAQLASHTHTGTTNSDGAHTHPYSGSQDNNGAATAGSSTGFTYNKGLTSRTTSSGGAHTHGFATESAGGGEAHNNMQPSVCVNVYLKL